MTESDFVERLIKALSQPIAPAGAPAMVASYSQYKNLLSPVLSRPQPAPTAR